MNIWIQLWHISYPHLDQINQYHWYPWTSQSNPGICLFIFWSNKSISMISSDIHEHLSLILAHAILTFWSNKSILVISINIWVQLWHISYPHLDQINQYQWYPWTSQSNSTTCHTHILINWSIPVISMNIWVQLWHMPYSYFDQINQYWWYPWMSESNLTTCLICILIK